MKVLYIDDMPIYAVEETRHKYVEFPLEWIMATSAKEGMEILAQGGIGMILMDGMLPGEPYGHELVAQIRESGNQITICMFSSDDELNEKGQLAGAEFMVNKELFVQELGERTPGPEMLLLGAALTCAMLALASRS